MEKQLTTNFTEGPLLRQMIAFSLPFMAANLLQSLYNVVDMIIVGQFVGSAGLSAVSIGGMVTMLMTCICVGFSTGAQVMISQLVGRNATGDLKKAIGTIFTTFFILGVVTTILGVALVNVFVTVMNTPAEAVDQARAYMYICLGGMLMTVGYNAMSAVLRGMGDSKRPLLFIAVASVTNLVLDVVFVALLDMSAAGAALATVIGQAVSFLFSVIYLYRRRDAFGFDFKLESFRPDFALMKLFIKLGVPVSFQMGAVSVSYMIISAAVNRYGLAASAISGVGTKLFSVISIITNSIQTACSGMVGQNISARKYDRVRKITLLGWGICICFGAVFCTVCMVFPKFVIGIFTTDGEVLDLARAYMNANVAGYVASFLMASSNGLITGVGAMTFNFIVAALDSVVARIGLSLLLGNGLGFGLSGFWWGGSLAGYITVIAGAVFFFSGRWKKYNLLGGDAEMEEK
jgi:putative MATE family efflux protein